MNGAPQQYNMPQQPEFSEEIRLTKSTADEKNYDLLANLFSCIKCIDYLERTFASGNLEEKVYIDRCRQLLVQFRNVMKSVATIAPDHKRFANDFNMQCPAGLARIDAGVPMPSNAGTSQIVAIQTVTEKFITLLDILNMNMRSKTDLFMPIEETYNAMQTVHILPDDFSGKAEIKHWLDRLDMMAAVDELSEDDTSDLLLAVDKVYSRVKDIISRE